MTPASDEGAAPQGAAPRGWFWPTAARKAHFDGGDGLALCGKWARINPFSGAAAPIDGGADSPPSRDDCATCRRKLDA